MSNGKKSVLDGKLTNEQLGGLTRRNNEIIRRINDGTLKYDDAMTLLQGFVIQGKIAHLGVLKGTHEIIPISHVIDCDVKPHAPKGLEVSLQRKGGSVSFDSLGISLLNIKHTNGSIVKLYKESMELKVLNANVLFYLLKNTNLIPNEWEFKNILFLGTSYKNQNNSLCFLYLKRNFEICGGPWEYGIASTEDDLYLFDIAIAS